MSKAAKDDKTSKTAEAAAFNKRSVGSRYERIAARFLELSGYRILELNYRCRRAEVDIIAMDGNTLCFVEVKYRHDLSYGYPAEAVDADKRKKLCIAARHYIAVNHSYDTPSRFDVVEIAGNKIRIIRNFFSV